MLYLITYDVPEEYPKLRRKISLILKNWGLQRIQYSVFIGDISRNFAETIALQINEVIKNEPADVRIFPICQKCLEKAIIIANNNLYEKEKTVVF